MKPLSREFLLKRGFCCNNGCVNCPYMKKLKTKEDLIETVLEQIVLDVHCGDSEAIEELLHFAPIENLIGYLPEEDWGKFNHLVAEEYLKKSEDRVENMMTEIHTENAIKNLIKMYPNDADLGKQIRTRWQNYTKP